MSGQSMAARSLLLVALSISPVLGTESEVTVLFGMGGAPEVGEIWTSPKANIRTVGAPVIVDSYITLEKSELWPAGAGACQAGSVYEVRATWRNKTASPILLDPTGVKTVLRHLDGKEPRLLSVSFFSQLVVPGAYFSGVFRIQLVSCTPFQFRVNVIANTTPLEIKLSFLPLDEPRNTEPKLRNVIVDSDGTYAEVAMIEAVAVRGDTGERMSAWEGSVDLFEMGVKKAYGGDSTLPRSLGFLFGRTWFLAKSLAGPDCSGVPCDGSNGNSPPAAQLQTAPFRVHGAPFFAVPQWVDADNDRVFDWVNARVTDIRAKGTGDVATVMSAIAEYSVNKGEFLGKTVFSTRHVDMNPYFLAMRRNLAAGTPCGHASSGLFTSTWLHEARHAYQGLMAAADNFVRDADHDWLLSSVSLAIALRASIDSDVERDVCNVNREGGPAGTPELLRRRFRGVSVKDLFSWKLFADADPGGNLYAQGYGPAVWGLEWDAYKFAADNQASVK